MYEEMVLVVYFSRAEKMTVLFLYRKIRFLLSTQFNTLSVGTDSETGDSLLMFFNGHTLNIGFQTALFFKHGIGSKDGMFFSIIYVFQTVSGIITFKFNFE